jgi:hypothetical protein
MNFDVTGLGVSFDDTLKSQLVDKLPFEKEDSNFAPKPSVAVGIQVDGGLEFGVIYLSVLNSFLCSES